MSRVAGEAAVSQCTTLSAADTHTAVQPSPEAEVVASTPAEETLTHARSESEVGPSRQEVAHDMAPPGMALEQAGDHAAWWGNLFVRCVR
jgi:hypothetical protein